MQLKPEKIIQHRVYAGDNSVTKTLGAKYSVAVGLDVLLTLKFPPLGIVACVATLGMGVEDKASLIGLNKRQSNLVQLKEVDGLEESVASFLEKLHEIPDDDLLPILTATKEGYALSSWVMLKGSNASFQCHAAIESAVTDPTGDNYQCAKTQLKEYLENSDNHGKKLFVKLCLAIQEHTSSGPAPRSP